MTEALLVLEDGTSFRGRSFGAEGEIFGEAVFNTATCGYQEVLTDPSYSGQIVTMAAPHQGNYGVNPEDAESPRVRAAGVVVREASRRHSSWRAAGSLHQCLRGAGVAGIEGIDTRRLVLRVRERGAMRAALSTVDLDVASLLERARRAPGMEGAELASSATCDEPYEARRVVGPARPVDGRVFRVAAFDYGMKGGILRRLAEAGCETTVFPATTPAEAVLSGRFQGAFLSNGPGDPAATTYAIGVVRALLGTLPLFGICLGHQLLALALGGRTYKMRFGHRGVNQPVRDVEAERVEITSHNHGFAVNPRGWGDADGARAEASPPSVTPDQRPPVVETALGSVALTHWNLNDGTLEGLRCLDVPAFSVQYHPEARPGPHDAAHLFSRFRRLMAGAPAR